MRNSKASKYSERLKHPKWSKLLKHPKWEKKRLEIMSRDNFSCCKCFDDDSTLNVHHITHLKGKKPWEYDNKLLVTICNECHEIEHDENIDISEDLHTMLRGAGLPASVIFDMVPSFWDLFRLGDSNPYLIMDLITGIIDGVGTGSISCLDLIDLMSKSRENKETS